MLNWFKRVHKKSFITTHWGIDDIEGFEKINNHESTQYANLDSSRIIYLSVLTVSGSDVFTIKTFTADEPIVVEDTNGWQLKGFKKSNNHILVCIISLKNQEDVEWAKEFFQSIKPLNDKS